jgi:hypothetical protein
VVGEHCFDIGLGNTVDFPHLAVKVGLFLAFLEGKICNYSITTSSIEYFFLLAIGDTGHLLLDFSTPN